MSWALTLSRSSFAIAFGVVVGAGAAMIGVHTAATRGDRTVAAVAAPDPGPAIVDVSKSALDHIGAVDGLVGLLALSPGERVTAIDGRATADGVVELAAAWQRAAPGRYIDVELAGTRRVLLLVHP